MRKTFYKKAIYAIAVILLMYNTQTTKAQDAPKDEFKPSGKVWGLVFGDYYYKVHSDSLNRGNTQYANTPKNMNAFDFRRAYLGYDYNISEKFSTEFLLSYEPGTVLSDGSTRTFFLKAANIRWKNIFKGSDLVVGQMSTPSFSMMSEKVWAYRSVEKTISDMRGIAKSNDVGVTLQGKFCNTDKCEFGYNIMIGDGTAQKVPTTIFKRGYGDLYAKFLNKKIIIDIYGDYYRYQLSPYHKSVYTMKAFVAFQSDIFTAGVEAFMQPTENGAIYIPASLTTKDTASTSSFGVSVFVRGMIIKDKLNYFARYDMYNPDTKFNANSTYTTGSLPVTENFITAGLDYTPIKNVHFMPNLWYDGYGSRAKNVKGKVKSDYDLAPRITFYYTFNK